MYEERRILMQPIFTIHAGEYLVGSYIEQNLKDNKGKRINVWLPSKDTGIDLLLTNFDNFKITSIQVKFSKDFLVTHGRKEYQRKLVSCGWWTLNREKIQNSKADFWIFVLHTFNNKNMQYVFLKPSELLARMDKLHGNSKSLQSYLWVTDNNKCWETRGLKKKETDLIVSDSYKEASRNFTLYLNNWDSIINKLS